MHQGPRSFVPHGLGPKETSKLLIARGWGIEQGGEPLEYISRERKIPSIQQHGFRFPTCGVEHEIGPAPAKRFRSPVNQGLLSVTGAEVDRLSLPPHGSGFRMLHVTPPSRRPHYTRVCAHCTHIHTLNAQWSLAGSASMSRRGIARHKCEERAAANESTGVVAFLTRPPTGRHFSPTRPSDGFAFDFPGRAISQTKASRGRALREHRRSSAVIPSAIPSRQQALPKMSVSRYPASTVSEAMIVREELAPQRSLRYCRP